MLGEKDYIPVEFLDTRCFETSCVSIGNFDALHKGHRVLIDQLIKLSKEKKIRSVVITFTPHPKEYFSKKRTKLIVPIFERVRLLKQAGVDDVKVIRFSEKLASLSYESFLDHLIDQYCLKHLVMGENTRLGKNRLGSPKDIKRYLSKNNVDSSIVELESTESQYISSSKIRSLIAKGEMINAKKLLGYAYFLKGQIVKGSGRGTGLGFPTANLDYDESLCLPESGVYITNVELNQKSYPALTNVGYSPTIKNSKDITVESFIPEYEGEALYGKKITVNFHSYLRAEKKFSSKEDLINQIKEDLLKLKL